MLLDIVKYPDPFLKNICKPVERVDASIRPLCADMAETMYAAPGVGLAAPQVGKDVRILVMDPSGPEERRDLRVLINPELEPRGEIIVSAQEGCLSVPLDFRADVKRHERVLVRAQRLDGTTFEEEWDGYPAIIVQHEFDHLQGTLFIDHIGRLRRSLYDARVKKWMRKQS